MPGGHVAYTRTAAVYSTAAITEHDLDCSSSSAGVEMLRKATRAFTQRVGSVYLVEANLLGFAGESTGLEEQCILSSAVKWALADYVTRFGSAPLQIVLHLDVNGTLALGDVAGSKRFGKIAGSLAGNVMKRADDKDIHLNDKTRQAMKAATTMPEEDLQAMYSVNYSGNDFVRAVLAALGALAPAAIRQLDEELAGDFKKSIESQAAKLAAKASAWESIEAPAVTVAIRTNGVEHRQASSYVQRLVMGVLGLELSEEKETVRRYVVTHLDEEKQVLFHPVLLEKMHTSKGAFTFDEYSKELSSVNGKKASAAAYHAISDGGLRKKDGKFNVRASPTRNNPRARARALLSTFALFSACPPRTTHTLCPIVAGLSRLVRGRGRQAGGAIERAAKVYHQAVARVVDDALDRRGGLEGLRAQELHADLAGAVVGTLR